MQTALKPHPAAELFPMMSGADMDALVADIKEHGQREPIVLHEGLILDGRNRYAACQKLGIVPATVEWDGNGAPPKAFVVSMNLHRRHLNESQRAMIAADLASLKSGQRADYARQSQTGVEISTPASNGEAGRLLNVNRTTVSAAKKVLHEGTPEEIAAIRSGEIAVHTIAKQIRRGDSPEKRKAKREAPLSQSGRNPERIQRAQLQADIWAHVDSALSALTSLPLPADVADVIGKNPQRSRVVESRLVRSLQWLKDFENVWRSRGQATPSN